MTSIFCPPFFFFLQTLFNFFRGLAVRFSTAEGNWAKQALLDMMNLLLCLYAREARAGGTTFTLVRLR